MTSWWHVKKLPEVEEPTLVDIKRAQERIKELGAVYRIPLVALHEDIETNAGIQGTIYLKLENLQPISSFKLRPAANVLLSRGEEDVRGKRRVITPSAGNMGQGVAWMVNYLNKKAETRYADEVLVIAPDHVPESKKSAMERMGVRIITVPFATWWTIVDPSSTQGIIDEQATPWHYSFHPDLRAHLDLNKEEWQNIFVHPVFDKLVMAGNGTIALEILEDVPDADSIIIPYGGGALACGIASGIRALNPNIKIYAVEVETAAPLSAAWEQDSPVEIQYNPSFVDGIGGSSVLPSMFTLAKRLLDGVLVVSLNEIQKAIKLIAERNKIIVEGAGAAAVAAALSGRAGHGKIVCICSGGGLNNEILASILTNHFMPT